MTEDKIIVNKEMKLWKLSDTLHLTHANTRFLWCCTKGQLFSLKLSSNIWFSFQREIYLPLFSLFWPYSLHVMSRMNL